jgi:hypothetical protein
VRDVKRASSVVGSICKAGILFDDELMDLDELQ